jgi:mannitol-1-phosphate/altronate dehydrogenase
VDEQGRFVEVDDPLAGRLRRLVEAGGSDPRPLLSERSLFGPLSEDDSFAAELEQAVRTLDASGTRAALESLLASEDEVAA